VIVAVDSDVGNFADLRGASWAYNDRRSHSGYGVTLDHLVRLGETAGYFGEVVKSGSHARSIRMVAAHEVDASAIDSHVLGVEFRSHPELAARLRIVGALGPSPIQPVAAARRLPEALKADLRAALLAMGDDPAGRAALDFAMVDRFVAVDDADYDPIRSMVRRFEEAGFTTLR